ncbi:hypothetical protein F511_40255 [Dorcoceras hygrometricum]|uniref:Uncharacterized protein n=1 Tax=Dorcoceras hygrometricum TaxID=472368 RepID=A0A2Z7AAD5_9LAMI|nr:hypothetical protein F511_40255 [Dorcoceras hygrometricum]
MDQEMREFRVTSCWFGKTVEEVERRRFVKLKRCVLEPTARRFLAIARRCRLKKSIRQRFAFTLKIQQMTCAMIKNQQIATGPVVEFEKKSALTNKEFSRWIISKANPAADDLAMQKFSSNAKFSSDADFIFSTKKLEFLDAKQDCCTGNFTSESRRDLSRVQGRFRAVTVKLRESEKQQFCTPKICGNFSRILSQSSVQATVLQVRDLGRIRAIDSLPDLVQTAGFVLPDFTPNSSQEPNTSAI